VNSVDNECFFSQFMQNSYFTFINDNSNSIKTGSNGSFFVISNCLSFFYFFQTQIFIYILKALKLIETELTVKETATHFQIKLRENLAISYFEQKLYTKAIEYFLSGSNVLNLYSCVYVILFGLSQRPKQQTF
jgi:hypothetical protein